MKDIILFYALVATLVVCRADMCKLLHSFESVSRSSVKGEWSYTYMHDFVQTKQNIMDIIDILINY